MESAEDNANYVFTETEVKPTVNYAKSLPLDDLLELGNKIWSEVRHNPDIKDEKKAEEIYYTIYNKYRDFGSSFPLILRWMVQMKKYSPKAFKKFLRKYSTANITSKKEFLILQADYIVYLFEEGKHYDKKHVNAYREFIIKQLLDEEEQMKKIDEEMKKELAILDDEKRKRLYEFIKYGSEKKLNNDISKDIINTQEKLNTQDNNVDGVQ